MGRRSILPELAEPVTHVDGIVERLELERRQQPEPRLLAQLPERGHGHAERNALGRWRALQQPIHRAHADLAEVAVRGKAVGHWRCRHRREVIRGLHREAKLAEFARKTFQYLGAVVAAVSAAIFAN